MKNKELYTHSHECILIERQAAEIHFHDRMNKKPLLNCKDSAGKKNLLNVIKSRDENFENVK